MAKVTAGRDQLGEFAPEFAHLNDDVLFGEVWAREDKLSPKLRSIVTVTALMASGVLDSSLKFHISKAKENGVTQEEMAEILTHAAFYAGRKHGLHSISQKKCIKIENPHPERQRKGAWKYEHPHRRFQKRR